MTEPVALPYPQTTEPRTPISSARALAASLLVAGLFGSLTIWARVDEGFDGLATTLIVAPVLVALGLLLAPRWHPPGSFERSPRIAAILLLSTSLVLREWVILLPVIAVPILGVVKYNAAMHEYRQLLPILRPPALPLRAHKPPASASLAKVLDNQPDVGAPQRIDLGDRGSVELRVTDRTENSVTWEVLDRTQLHQWVRVRGASAQWDETDEGMRATLMLDIEQDNVPGYHIDPTDAAGLRDIGKLLARLLTKASKPPSCNEHTPT